MHSYKKTFDTYMWVKNTPNKHEQELFRRAVKYIRRIAWIPGIEMVAIVNSLSMFATHKDSDIDIFIVTKPKMLWFVRFFVTITLYRLWVWRHGRDIAGNFCLSFFVTTDAMNMENIAIDNDIYFYYWIYYMKPVLVRWDIYERFLEANSWVKVDEKQRQENRRFLLSISIQGWKQWTQWGLGEETVWVRWEKWNWWVKRTSFSSPNGFGTFAIKSTESLCYICNTIIRSLFMPKTLRKYKKIWSPEWVVISDAMLKFHDRDRRVEIRDKIFQKNFDK